jgi:putative Ca2+/H+ antiporter (TMEM165/GDT1 family)
MVFVGVVLALFLLSSMAVYVGRMLMEKINKNTISRAAGVLFIVIGISFFF